jgi:hypothetical protein
MSNDEDDGVARAWRGRVVPVVLGVVAAVYFVGIFSEAAKTGSAARWLPAPLEYFTQVASLFPKATQHATDYRAEGFRCRDQTWFELDVAPWFPINADNKESRFHRTVDFYGSQHPQNSNWRPHRPTLRALEKFLTDHYDADVIDAAARGKDTSPIGGIRLVQLRLPVGTPRDGSPRYERRPLSEYGADERKDLYYTPESKREERCSLIGR